MITSNPRIDMVLRSLALSLDRNAWAAIPVVLLLGLIGALTPSTAAAMPAVEPFFEGGLWVSRYASDDAVVGDEVQYDAALLQFRAGDVISATETTQLTVGGRFGVGGIDTGIDGIDTSAVVDLVLDFTFEVGLVGIDEAPTWTFGVGFYTGPSWIILGSDDVTLTANYWSFGFNLGPRLYLTEHMFAAFTLDVAGLAGTSFTLSDGSTTTTFSDDPTDTGRVSVVFAFGARL